MANQPIVYAFIFARGGSKGLPGKNIRPLAGKPLLTRAIETAWEVPGVARVIVSTDSPEIADVALQSGAEVPFMRPAELARDDSAEWLAWQHALRAVGCGESVAPCDVFLSVPTTAPLRLPEDVALCVRTLLEYDCDAVITTTPAARHPMFNMVQEKENGEVALLMPPLGAITRRQDAPAAYDMTTVAYALRPLFVLQHSSIMQGRVRQVVIPRQRAVDIDDEQDFKMAELLLATRPKKSLATL